MVLMSSILEQKIEVEFFRELNYGIPQYVMI